MSVFFHFIDISSFIIILLLLTHAINAGKIWDFLREDEPNLPSSPPPPKNPILLQPCPVDDIDSTDYQNVNLQPFIIQWNKYLIEGDGEGVPVPSLTEECGKTPETCERRPINWSASNNNNSQPKNVIIDTDFVNEVDDYVAVTWALLSSIGPSKQLNITAIVAAPFSFRYRFLPLLKAQELFEEDKESQILDSAEDGGLNPIQREFLFGPPTNPGGQLKSLLRLKDVGVNPKLMVERDNHATWCPDRGMEESYQGLKNFLQLFENANTGGGISPIFANIAKLADKIVFRGQSKYVTGSSLLWNTKNDDDVEQCTTNDDDNGDNGDNDISEGVIEIIAQARKSSVNDPLFIVCIGAPTNIATALLSAPDIVGKIIVLWDASWSLANRGRVVSGSLNDGEDLLASRILFESGVRMLYFPGFPSGQTLQLSAPEMEAWYKGQGAVSEAIFQRYNNNPDAQFSGLGFGRYRNAGTTRIMWDVGNFIPFIIPSLLMVRAVPAPRLQRVKTVPNTCHGYESIGTTCKAFYPKDDVKSIDEEETYFCNQIDQYNLTRCNDAFWVDAPSNPNPVLEARKNLVEASMVGGLTGPGGSGLDLLNKLQAAGL